MYNMYFKYFIATLISMFLFSGCYSVVNDDGNSNEGSDNSTDSSSDSSSDKYDDTESESEGSDSDNISGCAYNGNFYKPGETFDAADGCNSCSCLAPECDDCENTVVCTMMACIEQPCEMLLEDECKNNAFCTPIMGQNIGTGIRDCVMIKREFAGCMSTDMDCGAAETFAKDSDNNCWIFPNTCLPQNGTWIENIDCSQQCLAIE